MATPFPGWIWDPVRGEYFYLNSHEECYVYQNGLKIPLGQAPANAGGRPREAHQPLPDDPRTLVSVEQLKEAERDSDNDDDEDAVVENMARMKLKGKGKEDNTKEDRRKYDKRRNERRRYDGKKDDKRKDEKSGGDKRRNDKRREERKKDRGNDRRDDRRDYRRDEGKEDKKEQAYIPGSSMTDPTLYNHGVYAQGFLRGGSTPKQYQQYQKLNTGYQRQKPAKKFFIKGKVFKTLWPESLGESNSSVTVTREVMFGQEIATKIRWFVVVKEADNFCTCLPIVTYNRQGVAKYGVKKGTHAIAFSSAYEPLPKQNELPTIGEDPMLPGIQIRPNKKGDKLDQMARIDFARMYTVEHNIKAYYFGDVASAYMGRLIQQWIRIISGKLIEAIAGEDMDNTHSSHMNFRDNFENNDESDESDESEDYDSEDDDDDDDDDYPEEENPEKLGQTPLSHASANKHEFVIKQLQNSNDQVADSEAHVESMAKLRQISNDQVTAAEAEVESVVELTQISNDQVAAMDVDVDSMVGLTQISNDLVIATEVDVDSVFELTQNSNDLVAATKADVDPMIGLTPNPNDQITATEADVESNSSLELSETFSVFSDGSMAESISSTASFPGVSQKASEQLADILAADPELQLLYQEALAKFDKAKFLRNHDHLLKKFFNHLRGEAQQINQIQTVRVLRGKHQREEVTELICTLLDPSNVGMLKALQRLQSQKPDRLYSLNRLLGAPILNQEQLGIEVPVPIEQSESETTGNDGENSSEGELDKVESYPLDAIVAFLTKGVPFHQFKTDLHRFIHPPTTLKEAISYSDPKFLQKFLEKHFDVVVKDEYSWLRELSDVGYTREEMAELLLEDVNDAPWIYFNPRKYQHHDIQEGVHLQECVHRVHSLGTHLSQQLVPSGLATSTDEKDILRSVQELCGLAGVTPISRNKREWNGDVTFEDGNSTAIVSYTLLTIEGYPGHSIMALRIKHALEGLCTAAGLVQTMGFCCDSFTILKSPSYDLNPEKRKLLKVELCQVELKLAAELFAEVKRLCLLDNATSSDATQVLAITVRILRPLLPGITSDLNEDTLDHIFHLCSLAVQFLCLGFLSYTQAHIGPFQPFFLDSPQKKIILLGKEIFKEQGETITAELVNFTCAANITQGPILVFDMVQTERDFTSIKHLPKYDLLASPEDVLDTWGPGQFVHRRGCKENPSAIIIGGGIIYANDPTCRTFHWSDSNDLEDLTLLPFDPHTKVTIGALVKVNDKCSIDEKSCWQKSSPAFGFLGTYRAHWIVDERQLQVQAGQYIVGQFNQTMSKRHGKTLKKYHLEQEDDLLLPFLETTWGLQVSFCTSVARRVPLRELIADVLPIFAKTLHFLPDLWEDLEIKHNISDAVQKQGFREWLKKLTAERQNYTLKLIRRILMILQYTGVDVEGKNLKIAWPQVGDVQRCFSIPCENQSFWARMLADSEDCATFAYISPKCLESQHVKCNGPSPIWQNASTMLETAVIHHQSIPSTVPLSLEDKKVYFIQKSSSLFLVKVHRPDRIGLACLVASPTRMPKAFQRRLIRKDERTPGRGLLRERHALYEPAEQVVVSTSRDIR